jgi:anaerobic ribonucleoside-triphosphate reductase activating protein
VSSRGRHQPVVAAASLRMHQPPAVSDVLGRGRRLVLWTQGCDLRCPGCITPGSHAHEGGLSVSPVGLARELAVGPVAGEVQGITISGGEPLLQPVALCALIDQLSQLRPRWTTVLYTGYPWAWLQRRASVEQQELLARVDVLVDGPYLRRRHRALLWRGSANQGLRALTLRGEKELNGLPDRPAGLEVETDAEGVRWVGVPSVPGLVERLARAAGAEP